MGGTVLVKWLLPLILFLLCLSKMSIAIRLLFRARLLIGAEFLVSYLIREGCVKPYRSLASRTACISGLQDFSSAFPFKKYYESPSSPSSSYAPTADCLSPAASSPFESTRNSFRTSPIDFFDARRTPQPS